jgi:stress response protein SCP2
MPTISGPAKDSVTELRISQEGARRFVVNLSWTPRELPDVKVEIADAPAKDAAGTTKAVFQLMKIFDAPRILFLSIVKLLTFGMYASKTARTEDKEGRDETADQFDLDLDCWIFNDDMQCKCLVGTEGEGLLIEGSKKVYHSGDDQSGMSGEQVCVETAGLPEDYRHFFFVVRSDCKYSLDQFKNPLIKLVDSKTEEAQLQNTLVPEGELDIVRAYNYAFCHVFREGDKWYFRNLDLHMGDGVEWDMTLPALVKKAQAA